MKTEAYDRTSSAQESTLCHTRRSHSEVDTITERKIQSALEHLMQERTVLVIAHRLSTVRQADNIVVLENGSIIEAGTHDELIARDGHYSNLWKHQSEFIPESGSRSTDWKFYVFFTS